MRLTIIIAALIVAAALLGAAYIAHQPRESVRQHQTEGYFDDVDGSDYFDVK